jgi:subtilisin family serine protease
VIAVGAEDGTGSVWPDSNQGPGVALFALGSTESDGDWPGNISGIDDRRLPLDDEFATEIPSGGATSQPVPTDTILAGTGQVMGTSFAAARVAGAAALILAAEPALAAGEVPLQSPVVIKTIVTRLC